MVSSGLRQVLERARMRFGVEMEILDANLRGVYPDGQTDLTRAIDESPIVRDALARILRSGRPERLQDGESDYALYPLGESLSRRRSGGLLAIRREAVDVADGDDHRLVRLCQRPDGDAERGRHSSGALRARCSRWSSRPCRRAFARRTDGGKMLLPGAAGLV